MDELYQSNLRRKPALNSSLKPENISSLRSVVKPYSILTWLSTRRLIDLDSETEFSRHCQKSNKTVQQRPLIG